MNDDLDSKSDSELNEIFAVEVMGKILYEDKQPGANGRKYWEEDGGSTVFYLPDQTFCADANAVLPWIEVQADTAPHQQAAAQFNGTEWSVVLFTDFDCPHPGSRRGVASTFARAAVIAIIRVKRANTAPLISGSKPQ